MVPFKIGVYYCILFNVFKYSKLRGRKENINCTTLKESSNEGDLLCYMQEITKPQITHKMKLVLSGKCNANSTNKELRYIFKFWLQ